MVAFYIIHVRVRLRIKIAVRISIYNLVSHVSCGKLTEQNERGFDETCRRNQSRVSPRVGPSMRNAQRSVDAVPELPCGHSLFVR